MVQDGNNFLDGKSFKRTFLYHGPMLGWTNYNATIRCIMYDIGKRFKRASISNEYKDKCSKFVCKDVQKNHDGISFMK